MSRGVCSDGEVEVVAPAVANDFDWDCCAGFEGAQIVVQLLRAGHAMTVESPEGVPGLEPGSLCGTVRGDFADPDVRERTVIFPADAPVTIFHAGADPDQVVRCFGSRMCPGRGISIGFHRSRLGGGCGGCDEAAGDREYQETCDDAICVHSVRGI